MANPWTTSHRWLQRGGGMWRKWRKCAERWLPERISMRWKVTASFAAVLVVLVVLGVVGVVRLNNMEAEVQVLTEHDLQVVQAAGALQGQVQQMEAAVRGYLVTGNRLLLTHDYQPAKQAYPAQMARLRQLLQTNTNSRNNLEQAAPALDQWVQYADRLIQLRDSGQMQLAVAAESAGTGQQQLDTVTSNLQQLIQRNQTNSQVRAAQLARMVRNTELAMVVLVLLASAVAIGFGGGLAVTAPRNLRRVIQVLEEMAAAGGDLRRRISGVHSRDEVQQLAETTNHLLEGVAGLVRQVSTTSSAVAASAQQLMAATDETTRAVGQIAETASEFAAISERTAQSLAEMNRSLTAVDAQGSEVVTQANEVVQAVGQVVQAVARGEQSVEQVQAAMRAAEEASLDASQHVTELGRSAEQISHISGTIRKIAEQTNLLALNAAIEAARAGEAGRGFAVVAQEVRRLADQTRVAAREIEEIVQNNLALTARVASAMRNGADVVADSVQASQQTVKVLTDIAQSVHKVEEAAQAILASVHAQAERTRSALAAVETVSSSMEQVAAGSEENAASSQECLATVEEIAASAQQLAQMAQALHSAVARFQL
ncbi:MAG: CHASE3 domain-containing protein [Alicyclobacillus sp.]|nr:CHASE3 domain-containing protein [Alicyclobacillus sp.]